MYKHLYLSFTFCLITLNYWAEGTKNVVTDTTSPVEFVLHDIGLAAINYYTYTATADKRLYIRVGDQNREEIHFGFKLRSTHPKWGSALTTTLYFRIKDPLGNIVYGPELVPTASGTAYIESYLQAQQGPEMTAATGGYNSRSFTPSLPGDYYIEFNDAPVTAGSGFWTMFEYFDVQVVDKIDSTNLDGRIWTNTLYLNTPPMNAGEGDFTKPFDTTLHVFHDDSILTSVQFDNMRGLGFAVFCNSYGPQNTGDVVNDRKSVAGQVEDPKYKLFLSYPEAVEFPPTSTTPSILDSKIEGCRPIGYTFTINVSNNGFVNGYFDLNGNGVFNPGTADLEFIFNVDAGENTYDWDGLDGLGNPVPDNTIIELIAKFNAGVTHLPLYDVEANPNGFEVKTLAPAGGVQEVYWNDSDVGGADNTTVPCDGLTAVCHSWADPFGDAKTLNTYWITHFDYDTITFTFYDDCTPIAVRDTAIIPKNTAISIDVQANDSEPDGDAMVTAIIVGSGPENGMVSLDGNNILYTPDNNYLGNDSFMYSVCDGGAPPPILCDTNTVFVKVQCDDDNLDGDLEGTGDPDGDGIDNDCDLDADNDGILDSVEGLGDADGDGVANFLDLDSDNDGIPDAIEANGGVAPANYNPNTGRIEDADTDMDGLVNSADNSPAIAYTVASSSTLTNPDTDGDGVFNYLDLDSDNDGIVDAIEAGGTDANGDGFQDSFIDVNGDGIKDNLLSTPLTLLNTDGTGSFNYLDNDSDGDGISDNREAQTTPGYSPIVSYVDSDGDGLIDQYDLNSGNSPLSPYNHDGDALPDYIDLDSDNDDVNDIIEANDANMDGLADAAASGTDTDGDGIDDNFDANSGAYSAASNYGFQNTDGDAQPDWRDNDDDDDGILTANEIPDVGPANGIPDYFEASLCGAGLVFSGTVTVSGNADVVYSQNAVTSPANALGVPDLAFAELRAGAWEIVDLTDTVLAGNTITLSLAKASGGGTPTADIEQSLDGISFANVQTYTSTVTNPTFENFLYTITANTRFIRVTRTSRRIAFESVSYSFDKPLCLPDTDEDGIADLNDLDNDNDGIPDSVEGTGDKDGDGITDNYDLDSDNDGLPDALEANDGSMPANMTNQGKYSGSYVKLNDANSNGWASDNDHLEGGTNLADSDQDSDGFPARCDLDSDEDCIPDAIEANGGSLPSNMNDNGQYPSAYGMANDTDGDGLINDVDLDQGGAILNNLNSESTGNPDYLDDDSEDDGISDLLEGADPDLILLNADGDADGLDDVCDTDAGGTAVNLPDQDSDGLPDYLDKCMFTTGPGSWETSGTWNEGRIPNCDDCLEINHAITMSNVSYGSNININVGGSINPGAYTLNVCGDLTNTGSGISNSGTVCLNGSSSTQTITGDFNFNTLCIDNANGVNLIGGTVCVFDEVLLTEGQLDVSGATDFILKCIDETESARFSGAGIGSVIGDTRLERCIDGCEGFLSFGAPFDMTYEDFIDVYFQGFPGTYYDTLWPNTYYYDETAIGVADSGYTVPDTMDANITGGTGFLNYVWTSIFPYEVQVKGPFSLDPFDLPISYTTTAAGNQHDGFNLVANPYPATIDWSKASGWTKVGCCDAIYTYNRCQNQYSSFVSGIGVNNGTSLVSPYSAFWVKAHQGTSSIQINRNAIVDENQALYNTLPLSCLKARVGSYGYEDELAISFGDTVSSNGLGSWYGATKIFTNAYYYPSFYSIQDQPYAHYDMSINMMQDIGGYREVQLMFKAQFANQYTIDFSGIETFDPEVCVLLEDSVTGTALNLREHTTYTFDVSDTGTYSRFKLIFSKPLDVVTTDNECANSTRGKAVVNTSGLTGTFEWQNSSGLVLSQSGPSQSDSLENLSGGYYRVVFTSNDGACGTLVKEFSISQPLEINTEITSTAPSSCNAEDGEVNVEVLSGGTAPYDIIWESGSQNVSRDNLSAGTYLATLTDALGCNSEIEIDLGQTSSINLFFLLETDTLIIGFNQELVTTNLSYGASEFEWRFGDGQTSTLQEPTHQYSEAGVYTIELTGTSANGLCEVSIQQTVVVIDPNQSSVPIIEHGHISLLQNPVDQELVIRLNGHKNNVDRIEIYSNNGKLMYNTQIIHTQTEISTAQWATGTYFINVVNDKNVMQKEVVVSH